MCFYLHLTARRHGARLIPECERVPDIATKRRLHIIIAIWNVTTVLHAWGTGFWHTVTLGCCFQLKTSLSSWTDQKNPLPCTPYDSIYSKWALWNWKEFRDSLVEGCCAFELQSLTFHLLSPDHASDKKSVARGSACPFYHHQISRPECQRVISGQHGGDARPNHRLAVRRSHLAISVCQTDRQADRGVKLTVREGCMPAHPEYEPAPNSNHFARIAEDTSCCKRAAYFITAAPTPTHPNPAPSFWLIKTHEKKNQYSIIWPGVSVKG